MDPPPLERTRETLYALVDCNNFYASCERVFDPSLRRVPVAVLSNNDGCVIARSGELKEMGVNMGLPYFQIRDLERSGQIRVLSSNYALYGDLSARVMETLHTLAPDVEIYSIDEAFLDLSTLIAHNSREQFSQFAAKVKSRVGQWTGIPVSVGIAPTRTLAKLANRYAKKVPGSDGTLSLYQNPDLTRRLLEESPVGDIWGVGHRSVDFLKKRGIHSAQDFVNADAKWIRKHLTITGLRTQTELRGVCCTEPDALSPSRKAIHSSRSFGRGVKTLSEMQEATASYAEQSWRKLRRAKMAAGLISVYVATNRFKNEAQYFNQASYLYPSPVEDLRQISTVAVRLLEQIFRKGFSYKKCGVMLDSLVGSDQIQMDLFQEPTIDRSRELRLMETIEKINQEYGARTLRYASTGSGCSRDWHTRFDRLSPRYTTRWSDLPEVW